MTGLCAVQSGAAKSGPATLIRPRPWPNPQGGSDVAKPTCSIGDCEREVLARGWCGTHYKRWRKLGDPLAGTPVNVARSRDERLDAHVVKGDGCWEWTGTVSSWTGYGTIGNVGVHRLMFERHVGPIPDGATIDHMCHNEAAHAGLCEGGNTCLHRRCCNPEHLQLVTHGENLAASPLTFNGRGRTLCAVEDCDRRLDRHTGYCATHHRRFVKYGDPGRISERLTRPAVCSVEECDEAHHANGYCSVHAARVRVHGDPHVVKQLQTSNRPDVCEVDGCGRPHKARGWCGSHWVRWRTHGDVMADVPIGTQVSP